MPRWARLRRGFGAAGLAAAGLAAASLAAGPALAGAEPGPAPAELGRAIYQRGEAPRTQEARIGDPPSPAPLALFACQGCHGDDGRGRREGGVTAPEIRWSYLTKPYAVRGGGERRRPPYDERLFARVLRQGTDSAGQKLTAAMPRYPLDDRELAGLIAFLRRLDQADQAASEAIAIGVRLPPGRPGEVMRQVLEAYAAEINQSPPPGSASVSPALRAPARPGEQDELPAGSAGGLPAAPARRAERQQGGIFERRLELRFQEDREAFAAGLAAGLDLAIPVPGEKSAAPPADAVPVVALFPAGSAAAASRFTVYSGPEDRAATLEKFARASLGLAAAEIAIYAAADAPPSDPAVKALLYPGRDAEALRRALAGLPADLILLLPGWLESPPLMELARRHGGPVYVALPPTAHLVGRKGRELLARLAERHALPADQQLVQQWTLAAALALEAALESAGRDLHPDALPAILESLPQIETGFGPALRFSPARHLGARGAVVLRLGRGGAPSAEPSADGPWVPLD